MVIIALTVGGAGIAALGIAATGMMSSGSPDPASPRGLGSPTTVVPLDPAASGEPAEVAGCPTPTVHIDPLVDLQSVLDDARPGDVLVLSPGRYVGEFVARVSGTPEAPITLCGEAAAVLDGGSVDGGYGFHLDGVAHWRLVGFTVTNAQKGVMADATSFTTIEGLTVTHIGDEAIHLRANSTDNAVLGNRISDTGNRRPKFGEGVYVGTAESNWCDISDCVPDRSDGNLVEGNLISATTAEAIDIKEGTTGGVVRANRFDGSSLTGADSWVDVKGNGWLIEGNEGVHSPMDGFQTHEIVDGWGRGNVFRDNVADVRGPGYGFSLTPPLDNVVECRNTAFSAGEGLTNVTCSG